MNDKNTFSISAVLRRRPDAFADVRGGIKYPDIRGTVSFYQTRAGTLVYTFIRELPTAERPCRGRIFAFHIHEGGSCTGGADDEFSNVGRHYDPDRCEHPFHAGDMPPLFGNDGYALSVFLTDRFSVSDIIGRTVIIHDKPDDLTSQPSGNAGMKIACGQIKRSCRR